MQSIEKRIAALEASTTDETMKIVIIEDGETRADALKRAGLLPDAADVACVVFVSPTDERL